MLLRLVFSGPARLRKAMQQPGAASPERLRSGVMNLTLCRSLAHQAIWARPAVTRPCKAVRTLWRPGAASPGRHKSGVLTLAACRSLAHQANWAKPAATRPCTAAHGHAATRCREPRTPQKRCPDPGTMQKVGPPGQLGQASCYKALQGCARPCGNQVPRVQEATKVASSWARQAATRPCQAVRGHVAIR